MYLLDRYAVYLSFLQTFVYDTCVKLSCIASRQRLHTLMCSAFRQEMSTFMCTCLLKENTFMSNFMQIALHIRLFLQIHIVKLFCCSMVLLTSQRRLIFTFFPLSFVVVNHSNVTYAPSSIAEMIATKVNLCAEFDSRYGVNTS